MGLLTDFSSKAEIHRREVVKRFDDFFASYFGKLEKLSAPMSHDLLVTLVARAPASPVAKAVRRHADELAGLGVQLQVIFSNIDPVSDFADFTEMTDSDNDDNCLNASLRWAKNPSLLEAHEQLVLGDAHCWTGDAMRRSPDVRFALDMFGMEGGEDVKLGQIAFEGIWSVSDTIPKSRFRSASNGDAGVLKFDGMHDQLLELAMAGDFTTRH